MDKPHMDILQYELTTYRHVDQTLKIKLFFLTGHYESLSHGIMQR